MSRKLGRMRRRLSRRHLPYQMDGFGESSLLALGVKGDSGIHKLFNNVETRRDVSTGFDREETEHLITERRGRDGDQRSTGSR